MIDCCTGCQAVVAWQAEQVLDVGMCVAFLPVAVVPLWQLTQLPVMPLWSKALAGIHAMVVWQALHSCAVERCVADLPVAMVPLWQEEQVPTTSL